MNRSALRGLSIGIVLAWMTQLCGGMSFVTYTVYIFEKAGVTRIDPYIASISVGVVQILGCLLTTQLSDRWGRKFLTLASLIAAAFGLLAFAIYSYLQHIGHDLSSLDWIPVFCLCFVVFVSSAGIIPLYIICTVENLPSKVSSKIITQC